MSLQNLIDSHVYTDLTPAAKAFFDSIESAPDGKEFAKLENTAATFETKATEARNKATTALNALVTQMEGAVNDMKLTGASYEDIEAITEAMEELVRGYAYDQGLECEWSFGEGAPEMWEASTC